MPRKSAEAFDMIVTAQWTLQNCLLLWIIFFNMYDPRRYFRSFYHGAAITAIRRYWHLPGFQKFVPAAWSSYVRMALQTFFLNYSLSLIFVSSLKTCLLSTRCESDSNSSDTRRNINHVHSVCLHNCLGHLVMLCAVHWSTSSIVQTPSSVKITKCCQVFILKRPNNSEKT